MRLNVVRAITLSLSVVAGSSVAGDRQDVGVERASDYWASGQLQAALETIDGLLEAGEAGPDGHLLRAGICLDLAELDQAERSLRLAEEAGAAQETLSIARARLRLAETDPEWVVQQIVPESFEASEIRSVVRGLRAKAYLMTEQRALAADEAENALALRSENVEARLVLASLAIGRGDLESARQHAQYALSVGERVDEVWQMWAAVDVAAGDINAAVAALSRAEVFSRRKWIPRFKLAVLRIEQGQLKAAEADLSLVESFFPGFPELLYARGWLALRKGLFAESAVLLRRYLEADRVRPRAIFLLGIAEAQLGRLVEAEALLARFNSERPESIGGAVALARVLAQRERWGAAAEVLLPMAEGEIKQPEILRLLAGAHIAMGERQRAQGWLDQAVELDPSDRGLVTASAENLVRLGRWEEAAALSGRASGAPGRGGIDGDLMSVRVPLQRGEWEQALAAAETVVDDHPDDPRSYNAMGLAALGIGNPMLAQERFSKALALNPGFTDAALNLGRLLRKEGDFESARKVLEALSDAKRASTEAPLALAHLDALQGNAIGQLTRLRSAVEQQPDNLRLRLAAANALLTAEQPDEALIVLSGAPEAQHDAPELLTLQGEAHLSGGATERAFQTYERLARVAPGALAHYLLARTHARRGELLAMRAELLDAMKRDAEHPLAPSVWHIALRALPGLEEKLDLIDALRDRAPDDVRLALARAKLLLAMSRNSEAVELLKGLLKPMPENRGVVLLLGRLLRSAGEADSMRALLQDWTTKHPDDTEVRSLLAEYMARGDDVSQAVELLQQLVSDHPDDVTSLNNLAWLLADSQPEKALELAERAYRLRPDAPEIDHTFGILLLRSGTDPWRAADLLAAARRARPADPTIALNYAEALVETGSSAAAIDILRALRDRSFADHERGMELLRKLEAEDAEVPVP